VNSVAEVVTLGEAGGITGKIVLINQAWQGDYGDTLGSRTSGPAAVSNYGGAACLVRSITPFSLYTPHTGSTTFRHNNQDVPMIPAVAITTEDSMMLARMANRTGMQIQIWMQVTSYTDVDAPSHNIFAEVTGSSIPNEVILFGGHIDSWDVGQGAIDDAGGVIISWEALRHIQMLDLKPKRTIRVIGWTNEENGLQGALKYAQEYGTKQNHVLVMESDSGVNNPQGINFTASKNLSVEQVAAQREIKRNTKMVGIRIWN